MKHYSKAGQKQLDPQTEAAYHTTELSPPTLALDNPLVYYVTLSDLARHAVAWCTSAVPGTLFQQLSPINRGIQGLSFEGDASDVVAYYTNIVAPIHFWNSSLPLDPRAYLAYLVSYAVVNPVLFKPDYRNADTAIIASVIEQIVNPYVGAYGSVLKPWLTYPEIVQNEIWANLHTNSVTAESALFGRATMMTPSAQSQIYPHHSNEPGIDTSSFHYKLAIPKPIQLRFAAYTWCGRRLDLDCGGRRSDPCEPRCREDWSPAGFAQRK